jgi:ribosomal protein S18 acetylase RimI-like enzyme
MSDVTRRVARESDVPFLLELRHQVMGPLHTAAEVDQSADLALARVRRHFDCAEILELDGVPIGLLKVVRSPAEWRISQIQLLPEHQRQGIGSRLLREMLDGATAAGVTVTLAALKMNPAVRLYCRLGFTIESESGKSVAMKFTPR